MSRTTRAEDLARFENAVIGQNHYIEEGVQIGFPYHESCGPARIGDNCQIHGGTIVYGDVTIGDYIPSRTWFGDNVFVGPGITFLNARYPGRREPMPEPRTATVEDDVMIGGGCTVLPGVHIGERSFIAAGAVVNKNVPAGSFVKGVPGEISTLPDDLDMPNNRELTMQPNSFWDPGLEYTGSALWPDYWTERFED